MIHHSSERISRILTAAAGLTPAALAGFGGVALLPAEAEAGPVQSAVVNAVIPDNISGLYIDVVTGTTATSGSGLPSWDIDPYSQSSGTGLSWFPGGGANDRGMMRYPGDTSGAAGNLGLGTLVSAAASFSQNTNPVSFGSNPGQWLLNGVNYFGFRFLNEADSQVHYGWGSMILGANPGTRTIGQIWYESTPNTGITVGNTLAAAAVPEPAPLALLAGGAAGLLAFRRRRAH